MEKRAVADELFGPLSNGGGLRGAKGDHIYEGGIRVSMTMQWDER